MADVDAVLNKWINVAMKRELFELRKELINLRDFLAGLLDDHQDYFMEHLPEIRRHLDEMRSTDEVERVKASLEARLEKMGW